MYKKGRNKLPKQNKPLTRKAPPIDWLWAAVLERKAVYGMDLQELAKVAGVSYTMMRQYIRKSPWEWPRAVRERILSEFNIQVEMGIDCVKLGEQ